MIPRSVGRRLERLERLAPRPPDPPLAADDPISLLAMCTTAELLYLERQGEQGDDALVAAFAALEARCHARRAAGMTDKEIRELGEQSECLYFDSAANRHRRVAPHPVDPAKWLDVGDAQEGLIDA
jgi:hypothetical protein